MYTETRKNETNRSEYRSGNSFPLSASQILEYIIEIQLFPIPNDLYLAIISAAIRVCKHSVEMVRRALFSIDKKRSSVGRLSGVKIRVHRNPITVTRPLGN